MGLLYGTLRWNVFQRWPVGCAIGRLTVETSVAHNEALKHRPHIHIRISDTGKGMPADVARKAFKPMFSTSKTGITAGWGLSSCAGFVRQSGGRIALDSAPGKGTRVDIFLPISSQDAGH